VETATSGRRVGAVLSGGSRALDGHARGRETAAQRPGRRWLDDGDVKAGRRRLLEGQVAGDDLRSRA
jgi:hypothetical protein